MRIIVSFLIIYLSLFGGTAYADDVETLEEGLQGILEGFKGDDLASFIKERGLFRRDATKAYIDNKIPRIVQFWRKDDNRILNLWIARYSAALRLEPKVKSHKDGTIAEYDVDGYRLVLVMLPDETKWRFKKGL